MLDFKTLNFLWKIENLAPPSKKWSSPEKTSILPKKLDETYLFRLASYFCMCRKVRFRPKFLSKSKFRSCRKFKSKFFKILEPPKISAFQNFTYNVGEFLKNPEDPPILKNLDLNFENDRNFELDRNFEQNLNLLHMQKYDASRKRHVSPSFFGKDWQFFGGTPFFRGGHQIFDFYKNLKAKCACRGLEAPNAKIKQNSCFNTNSCQFWPQSKKLGKTEGTKQTY